MRIIFLNRYFYPDHAPTSELLSDLAFALARRGAQVTVIASRQNYENARASYPPRSCVEGVDIWRVWTSRRGRQRLIGRSLDYLTFYLAAGWRTWRLARAGDIIVAKTDPPLLSVVVAPVAWLRGARLVNWLQDIFPEAAEALHVGGAAGRAAFSLLRPVRNWSLRSAKANVVVGESMALRLKAQGIAANTLRVIPNWSDGQQISPSPVGQSSLRQSWTPNARFVVCYAGNLGRAHDVSTIVEAMALLQQRAAGSPEDNDVASNIMFVFVGGGVQRAKLEREVLNRGLANVCMRPYQPRELLAETLGLADVHLVSLNPELEGVIVPSKFYGIAAAARPTLFIGAQDGELGRLIGEARCGFTVAPGDGTGLAARILQLAADPDLCASMGACARRAFEQRWDKTLAVAKWQEVLKSV
jgi:glycosyltransferase involved in cell wall biosynthesis